MDENSGQEMESGIPGSVVIEHCGFAAVVGRPSAGKSTFLNTLAGFKVSIVSSVPQTTRNTIRAIYNEDQLQIIFLDTPGMHFSEKKYNRNLMNTAKDALQESEAILYMSDLSRGFGKEEEMILEMLAEMESKVIVALNKSDTVPGEVSAQRKWDISNIINPVGFYTLSALDRENCIKIARAVGNLLPAATRYYDPEFYTDQDQFFRVGEIIREKVFRFMRQEIPHSTYVSVDELNYDQERERILIRAAVNVEAESQKGMVVGKKGSMIKKISIASREDIEELFGMDCDLFLKVKVHKNWRKDDDFLKSRLN